MSAERSLDVLELTIRIHGYNVDGIRAFADEFCDGDLDHAIGEDLKLMTDDCTVTVYASDGDQEIGGHLRAMEGVIVKADLGDARKPGETYA